jgi:hypothetical protein
MLVKLGLAHADDQQAHPVSSLGLTRNRRIFVIHLHYVRLTGKVDIIGRKKTAQPAAAPNLIREVDGGVNCAIAPHWGVSKHGYQS